MKRLCVTAALLLCHALAHGNATILVVNDDPPGVGFNDETGATPVGSNPGTTIGQQRLIAFQFAADLWGSVIDSPVTIRISASFAPLTCSASSAVLASAGPNSVHAEFANAPLPLTWYPQALANSLAGFDQNPGDDMTASFNGSLDNNDNCLAGTNWYYGLDNSNPSQTIDFLNTVMHELAHGLGFSGVVDLTDGGLFGPPFLPDVFAAHTFDSTQMLHWDEMNNLQRTLSAVNNANLLWDGSNSATLAPVILSNGIGAGGLVRLYAPTSLNSGSSVYHWDTSLSPNALMEPILANSLESTATLDLTAMLLKDIGWRINDSDADLIADSYDNCPMAANMDQLDSDNNGIGDVCEGCTGVDTDNDGIPDACDNCTAVANSDQFDSDADGYGNVCDADLDDSGLVNFADLELFELAFFTTPLSAGWNPHADLDGSDSVNFSDLNIVRQQFFGPPGPSGVAP